MKWFLRDIEQKCDGLVGECLRYANPVDERDYMRFFDDTVTEPVNLTLQVQRSLLRRQQGLRDALDMTTSVERTKKVIKELNKKLSEGGFTQRWYKQ